jgi:hypothetical protein
MKPNQGNNYNHLKRLRELVCAKLKIDAFKFSNMNLNHFVHQNQALIKRAFALAANSVLLTGIVGIIPSIAVAESSSAFQLAQVQAIRTTSAQQGTLYLNKDRVYNYNLIVSQPSRIDGIYVPAGAVIVGRYEPAEGGLRYVANNVFFNGRYYPISVVSGVIRDIKDPRDTNVGAIAGDTGIGAAGGAIVGEIFGNADAGDIIGGAAAGAIVGNVTADRVVVINPDQPILLYD